MQDLIEARLGEMVTGVCAAHRAQGELRYERGYPPVVNTAAEVEFARSVAAEVWGRGKRRRQLHAVNGWRRLFLHAAGAAGLLFSDWQGRSGSRSCRCTTRAMTLRRHHSQWRALFLAPGRAWPAAIGEPGSSEGRVTNNKKQQDYSGTQHFGRSQTFFDSDIWWSFKRSPVTWWRPYWPQFAFRGGVGASAGAAQSLRSGANLAA